jgi:hypothetical protein
MISFESNCAGVVSDILDFRSIIEFSCRACFVLLFMEKYNEKHYGAVKRQRSESGQ